MKGNAMHVCPVCGWPLNTRGQLETHIEIKHSEVKFVAVTLHDGQFRIQIYHAYPPGEWDEIGGFWRASDDQHFVVLGQGIYAGEVDSDKLSADIAVFLGLGKRVL